jgi:hypothetical protein
MALKKSSQRYGLKTATSLHPEGSFSDTHPVTEPHEHVCIRRGNYRRVLPGLDVLHTYDAFMNLGHLTLQLGYEEESL